eukprot:1931374-Amphidinium_carterae.1
MCMTCGMPINIVRIGQSVRRLQPPKRSHTHPISMIWRLFASGLSLLVTWFGVKQLDQHRWFCGPILHWGRALVVNVVCTPVGPAPQRSDCLSPTCWFLALRAIHPLISTGCAL